MGNKTLYLHIGMHKTGSSALQTWLAEHTGKLAETGIQYPKYGAWDHKIPSGNGKYLFSKRKKLEKVIKYAESDVLLSSESLYSDLVLTDNIPHLKETLKKSDFQKCKVLIIIREPIGFLKSWWIQQIKRHKSTKTFEEFVKQDTRYNDLLDCIELLKLDPIFELSIINYDLNKHNLKKIYNDFLNRNIIQSLPRVNKTFGWADLNKFFALNMVSDLNSQMLIDALSQNSAHAQTCLDDEVYVALSGDKELHYQKIIEQLNFHMAEDLEMKTISPASENLFRDQQKSLREFRDLAENFAMKVEVNLQLKHYLKKIVRGIYQR